MMPTITLAGDRQAGKTHALLNLGAMEAENGNTVAYIADQGREAVEAFQRYENLHAATDTVERFYRALGNQHVRHKSGGVIYFHAGKHGRPDFDFSKVDVFLLDASPETCTQLAMATVNPDARVYRASPIGR